MFGIGGTSRLMFYSAAMLSWLAGVEGGAAQTAPASQQHLELLRWPLPAEASAYAGIDGKHIWRHVEEQAQISRRYRDSGNPQFWGRLAGTSADVESAQWMLAKYREIGLTDTRIQTVKYYRPLWRAKSWAVSATADGKTIDLSSAQPTESSPTAELDTEVVYVGLGSESDFAERDVKGKAILFIKETPGYNAGAAAAHNRAKGRGAAAIFVTDMRGGNYKVQSYRTSTDLPTFHLGTQDAMALRELIAGGGPAPRVRIRLDTEELLNQESYIVWGTLPGQTDETIYVLAHRDGYFDAAGDNASGVATVLALAEHFAKVPLSQRRRTMVFLGMDGHHSRPGGYGREWLVANRARFFSKTALIINAEHPAQVLTYGGATGGTNSSIPMDWYAGGASRPNLESISANAFSEFGVPLWSKPSQTPPGGELLRFYWFLPGVVAQSNDYIMMHTEADSPAAVSWTGLEASTRAFAKIIDEVNKLPLRELERPAGPDPAQPDGPRGYLSFKNCEAWLRDSSNTCVQ